MPNASKYNFAAVQLKEVSLGSTAKDWMHKGAKGDNWHMSLAPTNGNFEVMRKKTSWGEKHQ